MSKKGFTIVELAIVLVVIGIILGMAVKGKALVDAARMRAEVTKINKFEAAAYTYYARTNRLPAATSTSTLLIDNKSFIDKELLSARDLKNEMTGTGYVWAFFRCKVNTDNKSFIRDNSSSVCASSGTATSAAVATNARLACNIENMKDDDNITSGEGRLFTGLTAGTITEAGWTTSVFEDCDTLAASATSTYAYRVF